MGTKLLAGRTVSEADRIDRPLVTVVNEALARQYFRGASPIGKRLTFGRPIDKAPWVTVVGVVANEKQDGLDKPVQPQVYQHIGQQMQNPLTFVVRTPLDPETAVMMSRAQVRAVDKDLALTSIATLTAVVDESMGYRRLQTTLVAAFASVAMFLAGLGIYGVLAYFVSQRSRELGIRVALGARPAALVRLVVSEGLRPVAAGAIAGVAASLALTGLIQSLLFGIEPIDPPTYAMASVVLGAIATIACVLPTLRATRVDPLVALRED